MFSSIYNWARATAGTCNCPCMPGADLTWLQLESAPGIRIFGASAAQKTGGSQHCRLCTIFWWNCFRQCTIVWCIYCRQSTIVWCVYCRQCTIFWWRHSPNAVEGSNVQFIPSARQDHLAGLWSHSSPLLENSILKLWEEGTLRYPELIQFYTVDLATPAGVADLEHGTAASSVGWSDV